MALEGLGALPSGLLSLLLGLNRPGGQGSPAQAVLTTLQWDSRDRLQRAPHRSRKAAVSAQGSNHERHCDRTEEVAVGHSPCVASLPRVRQSTALG